MGCFQGTVYCRFSSVLCPKRFGEGKVACCVCQGVWCLAACSPYFQLGIDDQQTRGRGLHHDEVLDKTGGKREECTGLGCAWQQLKPKRQKEQAALQESTKWKRNLSQQDLGKWSLTQPNLLQSFDVLYVLNNILSSASQGDIIQIHHTKFGPELTTVMMHVE